jgi:hypothetical protein
MRTALLIPLLALGASLTFSGRAGAEETPAAESADAVSLAKQVAAGIQSIKDSTGTYPASATIPVTINGQTVQMTTTVTVQAGAFSFKSVPTAATLASSPVANMAVDISGSSASTLSLVGIYASGADKADIVGFSTSGTEFAVSYSLNGKTVATTTTVAVAGAMALPVAKATINEYHLPASSTTPSTAASAETDSDTPVTAEAGGDAGGASFMNGLEKVFVAPVTVPAFASAQTTPISPETP